MVKIEFKGCSTEILSTDPNGNSLSVKATGDMTLECDENTLDALTKRMEEAYYNHED